MCTVLTYDSIGLAYASLADVNTPGRPYAAQIELQRGSSTLPNFVSLRGNSPVSPKTISRTDSVPLIAVV